MNEVARRTYVDKANPYLTTGIWMSRIDKNEVMSEHGAKKREACSQDKRYYWGNHSIHQGNHEEELEKNAKEMGGGGELATFKN